MVCLVQRVNLYVGPYDLNLMMVIEQGAHFKSEYSKDEKSKILSGQEVEPGSYSSNPNHGSAPHHPAPHLWSCFSCSVAAFENSSTVCAYWVIVCVF